jgi:hypothetical protein
MNKQIEALKMAICDLELCNGAETVEYIIIHTHEAINACKEALASLESDALAEAEKQEPVALLEALSDLEHKQWMKWAKSIIDSEPISEARKQRWLTMMVDYKDLPDNIQEYDREWARKVMALYTHPATWQPLSDDEIASVIKTTFPVNVSVTNVDLKFARAIEQALKEKNHGKSDKSV